MSDPQEQSEYRCETCEFHKIKTKKILAGRRCRSCGAPQETTMKVHTCHGAMYQQDAYWVSARYGLTCHSKFKKIQE